VGGLADFYRWQSEGMDESGDNERAKVEAMIGGWKQLIGDGLRSLIDKLRVSRVEHCASCPQRHVGTGTPELCPHRLTPTRDWKRLIHIHDSCIMPRWSIAPIAAPRWRPMVNFLLTAAAYDKRIAAPVSTIGSI
jgi:hypothetical protein